MSSNWAVEEYIAERRRQGKLTRGDLIYQALESPASSWTALLIAVSLLVLATASVVIAAYQMSLEAKEVAARQTCELLPNGACAVSLSSISDWIFLGIFGFEVAVRLAVYVKPWSNMSLWVDIICLVPLVVRLTLSSQGLRPLELADPARTVSILVQALASLRLLKLTRYSSAAVILKRAIIDSSAALWIPFYLLCVLFTFIGGVVYAFEYQPDGPVESGRVTTLLECWWMMLVTMVTVGYGDFSPQSEVGRILTAVAMCLGLCFTAMPLAIVGNTFSIAWEARSLSQISEQMKKHLLDKGLNANNCQQAFADFDLDGNGSIDYKEFKRVVMEVLGVPLDVKKLRKVWRALDQDDSNIIKYQEFCVAIFPEYEPEAIEEVVEGPTTASASEVPDGQFPGPVEAAAQGVELGAAIESRLVALENAAARQAALEEALLRTQAQQSELQATMTEVCEHAARARFCALNALRSCL